MSFVVLPIQIIAQTISLNADDQNQESAAVDPNAAIWRPPQWNQPATTTITLPASGPDPNTGQATPQEVLVFDAILRADHFEDARVTEFPVQRGANISDHMTDEPAVLTLEIGMSDAMDSYSVGLWDGNPSKSVAAYQKLLELKMRQVLVSITTRLKNYDSMVCKTVRTSDTNRTRHSLRVTATFQQIFLATTTSAHSTISFVGSDTSSGGANTTPISGRYHDTQQTAVGSVQPLPVSDILKIQHLIPQLTNVPAAGEWSSNPVASLAGT